jgi:hypothetical protein
MGHKNLKLSLEDQQRLSQEWDKRNASELAYVPHDLLNTISIDEAELWNRELGKFASDYFSQVIKEGPVKDMGRRVKELESIIEFGPGKGYSYGWIRRAIDYGYKPIFIDVSRYACKVMEAKSEGMDWASTNPLSLAPSVRVGEIQSILADPGEIDPHLLMQVQFCFLCRVLGCVESNDSAKTVLELLGEMFFSSERDPEKTKRVVIVNTLRDHNPGWIGKTSRVYSKEFIISNAQRGAGRKLEIINEQLHNYYTQRVSAITLKSC